MKVLGLDTSAVQASVAVVENGKLVAERAQLPAEERPRAGALDVANHSAALLLLIDSVLRGKKLEFADLGAIGVSIGPGSFTGLRVGLSIAKGLVYGSDIPLFGVPTLNAMAHTVPCREEGAFICPMMDARKGQVYAALYHKAANGLAPLMTDTLDTPLNVLERVKALAPSACVFLGEATRVYRDLIERTMGEKARLTDGKGYDSTALAVARIAEARSREGAPEPLPMLTPHYLRPPDAVPPKPKV